ncbi:hypothetical protein ACFX15_006271 [Malus domestica]
MAKTPPPAKRKSERFEMKKSTQSPLRRSPRAKNHSSTSSGSKLSDGKSSASSLMELRNMEVRRREVGKSQKNSVVGKKILDYRSYKAMFLKNGKKDNAAVNESKGDCEKLLKVLRSSERESQPKDEEQHLRFQKKVVEGEYKQWTSCSGLSQGKRKGEQQLDVLSAIWEVESGKVVKKRRTVVNRNDDSPHLKPGSEGKSSPGCKKGASVTPADIVPDSSTRTTGCENTVTDENCASTSHNVDKNGLEKPESNLFESEERRKLCDGQKSLHLLLKPRMSKLCEILQLSEDLKDTVRMLLEYVMSNHRVDTKPATILQAFQISLCWAAASFLKQKVNHKESLLLAKQHLNFTCTKDEAYSFYSMLQCLKTTFLLHTGTFKDAESRKLAKLSGKSAQDHLNAKGTQSTTSNLQKVQSEVKDLTVNPEYVAHKDVSKSIKGIRKKFKKKMTKLTEKHKKEKIEFLKNYEEEKGCLEREHKTELAVIQSCFQINTSMRSDKLKKLEKEIEEHQQRVDIDLERLEALQQEALYKLMDKQKQLLEKVGSWARLKLPNRSSSNKPEPELECSQTSEQIRVNKDLDDFASLREHDLDKIVPSMTKGVIGLSGTPERNSDEAVACSGPIKKVTTPTGLHESVSSSNGLHKVVSISPPSSEEQIHAVTVASSDKVVDSGRLETVSSNDVLKDFAFVNPPSSEQQIPEKASKHGIVSSSNGLHNLESLSSSSSEERTRIVTVTVAPKDVELGVLEPVSLNDCLQNLVSVDLRSSEEQIYENITEHETVSLSPDLQYVVSMSPPSSEEEFQAVTVNIPDKVVGSEVLETVSPIDDLGNLVSVGPASSVGQTPEKTTKHDTVISSHGLHNLEYLDSPSFVEQNPEKSTEKENSELNAVASDSATRVNQQNGVDIAANENFSGKNTLVNSPAVELVTAVVDAGSVTLHQAHQDKGTLLATLREVQCGDAQAREMQNTAQPVEIQVSQSVATVAYVHSDLAVDNEPVVQVPQPPYSNAPDCNPLELTSVGGIEIQPSIEDHTIDQTAQGSYENAANLPDLSDQTFLQPLTLHQSVNIPTSGFGQLLPDTWATSATYAFNTHPIHAAPHMAYGMPLTSSPDPLQYELERLKKETDQNHKSHEDMKQRLKSDCEKEIEEATTEIRRKYEIRLLETEAEFHSKKKEQDAIRDQVIRNKILSWAFCKYMDLIRASSASGVQKDGNSNFVQQLHQLSMLQNAQRSSTVAGSSLASPPAASLATSIALTRSLQATPPAPAPACAPATNPHCTVPPTQTLPFLPAQYPSIPARPPHIGSFASIGIPRVGGDIRAPAPHLQPFRPSTSMSNWQSHSNSSAMSQSLPHMPRLPTPTQQSLPYNRAHHPETAGGLSGLRCNISALELLMNSQSGASPPGIFPSLLNLALSRDQLHLSSPAPTIGTCFNQVHTAGRTDVVCLSDDD